ncbi:hypothetical protein BDD12DRAFT_755635, partial [Trichophaea hybrida]
MEGLRISIILSFIGLTAHASPITYNTHVEPGFVSEPPQRGTISLLWSCVITCGLCIWTAVHPNIIPKQSATGRNIYKAVYMLVATLLPEFVVAIAIIEWIEAATIYCKLRNMRWDMKDIKLKRCIFVVMGGISAKAGKKTYTIEPDRFVKLAKAGAIRSRILKNATTADKGNSSNIAKLLVCVQIGWLMIGTATRKAVGLPITLLEIHVVIQVVFAMVMYGFW